ESVDELTRDRVGAGQEERAERAGGRYGDVGPMPEQFVKVRERALWLPVLGADQAVEADSLRARAPVAAVTHELRERAVLRCHLRQAGLNDAAARVPDHRDVEIAKNLVVVVHVAALVE